MTEADYQKLAAMQKELNRLSELHPAPPVQMSPVERRVFVDPPGRWMTTQ